MSSSVTCIQYTGYILYSLFAHDVISCHWTPSWLVVQIHFADYSEAIVSLQFNRYFYGIMNDNFKLYGLIRSEIKNEYYEKAKCFENQPRLRQLH